MNLYPLVFWSSSYLMSSSSVSTGVRWEPWTCRLHLGEEKEEVIPITRPMIKILLYYFTVHTYLLYLLDHFWGDCFFAHAFLCQIHRHRLVISASTRQLLVLSHLRKTSPPNSGNKHNNNRHISSTSQASSIGKEVTLFSIDLRGALSSWVWIAKHRSEQKYSLGSTKPIADTYIIITHTTSLLSSSFSKHHPNA